MGGLFSLWAAVGSPLAVLDHQFLTAHMVQHLLLMTVAAPLILLGAPVMMLLRGSPQRSVLGVLVSCWLAATCTVIGWHVPAVFEIGMRSERWHAAEHVCFFMAGLLFWWPVVQLGRSLAQERGWSVPLYLFMATLPCDALSAFLTFCNRLVYPHYLSAYRPFAVSALADQQCAGALMWVWSTFAYLAPAVVIAVRMLSPQRRVLSAEVF
jgi:cytochrome c oxidase assembly factor CtaG